MVINWQADEKLELTLEILGGGSPGITSVFGNALAEAASVCLDQQGHTSPTPMPVRGALSTEAMITWQTPNDQARRCWADPEVTTEHGAYGIAGLLVPRISRFNVIERSRKGTGFDFWLGDSTDEGPLFQGKARLEVSGIREGSNSKMSSRLREKIKQVERSDGSLPAIVVVVEFGSPQSVVAEK